MATTPYWGHLPDAKTVADSRRPSVSASTATALAAVTAITAAEAAASAKSHEPDHRPLLGPPVQLQPKQHLQQMQHQHQHQHQHSRQNRASVQTTNTEAPTESTQSPFASPISANFPLQGLAPRPPSFSYGAGQSAASPTYTYHYDTFPSLDDAYHPSIGINSNQHEQDLTVSEFAPTDLLPAAPDVPRGPPLSYRSPYSHDYPSTPSRRPDLALDTSPMDLAHPEQYYTGAHPQPESHPGRHASSASASAAVSAAAAAATSDPSGGPVRRSSTSGGQSDRRKKFEEVRSPLQKLELTLDSITKEEKRARVAAAEQAFRERESRVVSGQPPSQSQQQQHHEQQQQQLQQQLQQLQQQPYSPQRRSQTRSQQPQQVRFRERSSTITDEPRPLLQPDGSPVDESYSLIAPQYPAPPSAPAFAYRTQPQPQQQQPQLQLQPQLQPQPQQQQQAQAHQSAAASGIPQRNLSFRERAAQNDIRLPRADDLSQGSPIHPSGRVLPKRTSSKLTKEPPAELRANNQKRAAETSSARQPRDEDPATIPTRKRRPSVAAADAGYAGRPSFGGYDGASNDRSVPMTGPAAAPVAASAAVAAAAALPAATSATAAASSPARRVARFQGEDGEQQARFDNPHHHHISNMLYHARNDMEPGQGTYNRPMYLNEWKKGNVGTLHSGLLDLSESHSDSEPSKAWWERGGQRRTSTSSRTRRGEAFDGEYDDTIAPTRFKPPLHLVCGPLLRYCGMRTERASSNRMYRGNGATNIPDREFWRGSVMIVTRDGDSSYDIAPTLRLFVQPLELLPLPPSEVSGALPPEYVDPLVGYPKLGRNGETLYARPLEEVPEAKDLSRDETDNGLFEKTKSVPKGADPAGSFAARLKKTDTDGEREGKFKDVRGFRLHAERGVTFWRFNIEVELGPTQQRIAYRINRSPSTGFWVPAKGQAMHIMFYSCNGFSLNVNSDQFSGPDPMWRDVLNTHQTQPFHVMIGGGDQIYNDIVMDTTTHFRDWLGIRNPLAKLNAPFTAKMQDELEAFYLDRYAMWFSQGLFSLANAQIPMVNMYDDHDIIDGFGSYPHHFMNSPVFSGLGNVAFKYYMLFQHQSVLNETEESEPSWILGTTPGPYIEELSHSLFVSLGAKVSLLAVDCRTERTRDEVVREDSWRRVMDRCYAEIERGTTEHLLVLLGVPIAYPRLVWLENILTSRLMDPIKALGKTGLLGNFLNKFDGGVEVLDDLDDHWTAKDHKDERKVLIEDLQDLAADKSVRITILSGDVHLAAVGQFYSNPKLGIAKHHDFRYIPNIISSAIVNTPPPDLLADVLNKRNKVHHFDHVTDEDMIPLFGHGVDGKPRNNKRLLPHRNWCSIQPYVPGTTPQGSPNQSLYELDSHGQPPKRRRSNVLRRASIGGGRKSGPYGTGSRPPLSSNFFRTLSFRSGMSADNVGTSSAAAGNSSGMVGGGSGTISSSKGGVKRSYSLSRDFRPANIFRRLSRRGSASRRPDDGGINGNWGPESSDDVSSQGPPVPAKDSVHGSSSWQGNVANNSKFRRGSQAPPPSAAVPAGTNRHRPYGSLDGDDVSTASSGEDMPPVTSVATTAHHYAGHRAVPAGHRNGAPMMRGGAGSASELAGGQPYGRSEYEVGDETYFSVKRRPSGNQRALSSHAVPPPQPYAQQQQQRQQHYPYHRGGLDGKVRDQEATAAASAAVVDEGEEEPPVRRFYRTPTDLTAKQAKRAQDYEVNLEGGLDIRLNMEVNPKDSSGITVPYRLVVPRLWYAYEGEDSVAATAAHMAPTGLKRLLSLGGRKRASLEVQAQQHPPHGEGAVAAAS